MYVDRSRSVSSWTKNIPLKKNDQRSSRADQGLESFELDQRAGLFNPASCGRHSTPPSPPNHTHTHTHPTAIETRSIANNA
ncbi:hypothetical protein PGTUg99_014529 [Puccinia graminis f. sp. tritici]|uniref:Uncharacterized protein n=1 Tax=Puccinia graminis f. sp. tritici TaxID=56615 RepID=A0A5B0S4E0_PUCGR|nr:hypothetical protein PGTUg99_014529 [Puccinia graminis f. sp. tritici]